MASTIPAARPSRTWWPASAMLPWAGRAAFALIVFGPVAALCLVAVQALAADGLSAASAAIPSGRRLSVFVNSLGLAAAVGAGASLLGFFAASVLWSWRTKTGRTLRWLLLVAAPVPSYIHALAWSWAGQSVNGWIASWWVQTLALAPLAVMLALVGLESVDPRLIAAGRLLGPDGACLKGVVLPLALPPLASGAALLAVLSLADYTVPSLFQVNVYALDIFAEYSATGDPATTFLSAAPVLLVAVAVALASQSILRTAAVAPPWRDRAWAVPPRWPAWFAWSQRAALAVLGLQVLVPLTRLVVQTGSWRVLRDAVIAGDAEITTTVVTALLAGVLSIPLGLAVAPALGTHARRASFWWALVVIPLAVPAPLVGIGLITIWNRAGVPPLYGTWVMPVLAALARFAPITAIVLLAQMRRFDPALVDAARLLDASRTRVWMRIGLPLLAPALVASAAIVLALTAGELGATLMVLPPGHATLTLRIYNLLHYGATGTVGALCLVMTGLVVGACALGVAALAIGARAVAGGSGSAA